jgi:hypothetical protein
VLGGADFLVELRGFEPLAIAGSVRSPVGSPLGGFLHRPPGSPRERGRAPRHCGVRGGACRLPGYKVRRSGRFNHSGLGSYAGGRCPGDLPQGVRSIVPAPVLAQLRKNAIAAGSGTPSSARGAPAATAWPANRGADPHGHRNPVGPVLAGACASAPRSSSRPQLAVDRLFPRSEVSRLGPAQR